MLLNYKINCNSLIIFIILFFASRASILLVFYYCVKGGVNLLDAFGEDLKATLCRCDVMLLLLGSDVEVAAFCCAVHHASLAIEVATLLLLLYSSV